MSKINEFSDMLYKYLNEEDGRKYYNWCQIFNNVFECAKGEEQGQQFTQNTKRLEGAYVTMKQGNLTLSL